MKKSTKLLSIFLSILMVMSSVSVLAFAAKPEYKTVEALDKAGAYSQYGEVTRIPTDTRVSILFDMLDEILANAKGLPNISLLGININLSSLDNIMESLESLATALRPRGNLHWAMDLGILGDINKLDFDRWDYWKNPQKENMSRDTIPAQSRILYEILYFLEVNTKNNGLPTILQNFSLGLIGNFLPGNIKPMITNLPATIKGLVFPLFERWDDDAATMKLLNTNTNGLQAVVQKYIDGMITKNVSITNVNMDMSGKLSHTTLPVYTDANRPKNITDAKATRHYFVSEGEGANMKLTRYHWEFDDVNVQTGTYVVENTPSDIYHATKEGDHYRFTRYKNGTVQPDNELANLVWYENNTPALHTMHNENKETGIPTLKPDNTAVFNLDKNSILDIFYSFIPYLFDDMAVIVGNGSLKMEMARFFGAKFELLGDQGSAAVQEEAATHVGYVGDFFTKPQQAYIWDFSDYAVIDGTHYWRFKNDYYKADIGNTNEYFKLFNWDFVIEKELLFGDTAKGYINVFPKDVGEKGNLLLHINDLIWNVAKCVLNPDYVNPLASNPAYPQHANYPKLADIWQAGPNSNLLTNIQHLGQAVLAASPAAIFGSNYDLDDRYFSMIMNPGETEKDHQEILVGVACTLIKMLMPQMILPSGETFKQGGANHGTMLGAIFAAVTREVATQFVSTNYDALIYENYANRTFKKADNAYWLDVCATIGTDIGISYLRNLVDLGEEKPAWSGMYADKTYASEADLTVPGSDVKVWEARIDYLLDWGLGAETSCWKFQNIFPLQGQTIDLATVQDPWVKFGALFKTYLGPLVGLLNINMTDTNGTPWLEQFLKNDVVLAALSGDLTKIIDVLDLSKNKAFTDNNVWRQIYLFAKDVLNGLFKGVLGADLVPSTVKGSTPDTFLTQANIIEVVKALLGNLYTNVLHGTTRSSTDKRGPIANKTVPVVNEASVLPGVEKSVIATVLPILGRFIGWKTTAQELKEPTISVSNSANRNYFYTGEGATNSLKIQNNAVGMLEKHRDAKADAAYTMVVESVTSSVGKFTLASNTTIAPGASVPVTYDAQGANNQVVKIDVNYHFVFKDGTDLPSCTTTIYSYVTSVASDLNVGIEDSQNGDTQTGGYTWHITDPTYGNPMDAATFINGVSYKAGNTNSKKGQETGGTITYNNKGDRKYVTANDKGDFKYTGVGVGAIGTYYPLKAVVGAPFASLKSTDKIVLGGVQGQITYKKKTMPVNLNFGTLYLYDTADLEEAFNNLYSLQKSQFPGIAQQDWDALQTALLKAAALLKKPMTKATFDTDFAEANVQKLLTELTTAATKALQSFQMPVDTLTEALAKAEPGVNYDSTNLTMAPGREIDYQDYDLYEYFQYQDVREPLKRRINEYKKPADLTNYISSNPNLNPAIVAAAVKANPIVAYSLTQHTAKEVAERQAAQAYFLANQPKYTLLQNDDAAARLGYYQAICKLHPNKIVRNFLQEEVTLAATYVGEKAQYSARSYAAYEAALAKANAVLAKGAAALRSEAFDAKYELMKAINELVKLEYTRDGKVEKLSCDEAGFYTNLQDAKAEAEAIFANVESFSLTAAAKAELIEMYKKDKQRIADNPNLVVETPTDEVLKNMALGLLLASLGYEVEANGQKVELYPNSANAFLAKDRVYSANEGRKIDGKVEALKTAIARFESAVKLVPVQPGSSDINVNAIQKIVDGLNINNLNATAIQNLLKVEGAQGAIVKVTENAEGTCGTGATVTVENAGKALITYKVVVYGDVNGDAVIDAFDAADANAALKGNAKFEGVFALAADADHQNGFKLEDYSAIVADAAGDTPITQTVA